MKDSLTLYNEMMDQMRAEAMAEVMGRIQGTTPKKKGKPGPKPKSSRVAAARRAPADMAKLIGAISGYIKKNPAQKLEEIAEGMGMRTETLKAPVKKMVTEKLLTRKGVARGSRYTVKA